MQTARTHVLAALLAAAATEFDDRAGDEPATLDRLVAAYHAWIREHAAVVPRFDDVP